ncbi:site-2 protease family protein [Skermania piniformis]|uniref:Site-2 protease family protein n=1 Tax=Skermania pinensis TaxID=39122 RepID=A0ABX8S8Q2_9ACTN|nr:site-2 protease family protein [Skermania piniformis]QXQ13656.1 site-2 protease family protein [Skermania piniformis]
MATGALSGRAGLTPSPVFLATAAVTIGGGWLAARTDDPTGPTAKAGVFLLVVAGWIVTLCLHEFAHAVTAWRAGDRSVRQRGYLTLNPLRYANPVLSIGLPVLFIALGGIGLPGGAVLVQTDPARRGTQTLISLAGPAVNATAAVGLLIVIARFGSTASAPALWYGLSFLAFLQLTATVLNLLPVPGLDGYGALAPWLPADLRGSLDRFGGYGLLVVLALLFLPQVNAVFFDAVYGLFDLSGVPSDWSRYGASLLRFGY